MLNNIKPILIGCDEIMEYIGISSRPLFKIFIDAGMPAKLINNRWYAHIDNLNDYFRKVTYFHEKDPPDNAK